MFAPAYSSKRGESQRPTKKAQPETIAAAANPPTAREKGNGGRENRAGSEATRSGPGSTRIDARDRGRGGGETKGPSTT